MITGSTGMAPGTANANGNTTSELRVAALNATALPAGASRRAMHAMPQPISGAITAKATYTGITVKTASAAAPSCGTTDATTMNSTSAVAGTGNSPSPDDAPAP